MKINRPRMQQGLTRLSLTKKAVAETSDHYCGGSAPLPEIKMADVIAMRKPLDPRYFANAELQRQAPKAFALMPEAAEFHKNHDNTAERAALAEALRKYPQLKQFESLTWEQKEPLLRQVFATECEVLKMTPPELVIENGAIPGPAFFEFDPDNPTPGKVFLNPEVLGKMDNGYAPLLLLIHETRHSAQFQSAFSGSEGPVAEGFRAAYRAQKELKGFSFVDFTTLLNEYEAFQFANGVVELLTDGKVNTVGMGTLAGQFSDRGNLKTDLKILFEELPHEAILDVFNELERPHYEERQKG